MINERALSRRYKTLAIAINSPAISIQEMMSKMGKDAPLMLSFLLSLPFLLPLPIPGLSMILGLIIASLGLAISMGKPVWLPPFFREKKIDSTFIAQSIEKSVPLFQKLERVVHPRLEWLAQNTIIRIIAGLIILYCGIFLALPLFPGTNFPPAIVIAILSMGLIEEDGLLIGLGLFLFSLKFIVTVKASTYLVDYFISRI